jgi:acetylornithine deacetylase/succinyl-diaminopimelate desuccinylase-like protein
MRTLAGWLLICCGALAAASPHELAREIFQQLIEINTTDSIGNCTSAAEAVEARLKTVGIDSQILGPDPKKGNLVARYKGIGERKPIILLAHLDVVEARREDWSVDPFRFLEKDGFYYGRGTSDDKAQASIFVANLIRYKQENYKPDRDIILVLTADEEGGKFNGVAWLLKNHRELVDGALVLNEGGGGLMREGKRFQNGVQASEKVFQSFRLEATNSGGHSSLPRKDNAIYQLSAALGRLSQFDFPVKLNEVTATWFERSAKIQSNPDLELVTHHPPDAQAMARVSANPYFNALMRTTCVATMMEGGHAENALPQMARATVNCRMLPGESAASVQTALTGVVADANVKVTPVEPAKPSAPSPLSPEVMKPIEAITQKMWPGVPVVPLMGTGATDSLYFRQAGIAAYGVSGIFYDVDDNRAHGKDERVGAKEYFDGLDFLYQLVKALTSKQAI